MNTEEPARPASRFIKVKQSNSSVVYLFTKAEVLARFERGFLRDCAIYYGRDSRLPETVTLQGDVFVVLCEDNEPDYLFYLHKYCEGTVWKQFVDKKETLRLYIFYNMMGCGEMLPGVVGTDNSNSGHCTLV